MSSEINTNSLLFLYLVEGGKGGVGKSIFCMLLIDFLTKCKGRKILLIETDTSNPDVGKTFSNNDDVEVISLSLDNADGWIELVNYVEASQRDIVINSAARSGEAIKKFSSTLTGSLEELQRKLITFWLINRQRDSVELLKKYMDVVPGELKLKCAERLLTCPTSQIESLMIFILNVFLLLRPQKKCLSATVLN